MNDDPGPTVGERLTFGIPEVHVWRRVLAEGIDLAIRAAVLAEREACATEAESAEKYEQYVGEWYGIREPERESQALLNQLAKDIAAAIRSRP